MLAQGPQVKQLHPLGLKGPNLVFTGFGGGQHPQHGVGVRIKAAQICEKNLVVAQAIGGHQPKYQPPTRVRYQFCCLENRPITGQLAKLRLVQAIAPCPFGPIAGKGDRLLAGQHREHHAALLAAAAGQRIALQYPFQQFWSQGALGQGLESS